MGCSSSRDNDPVFEQTDEALARHLGSLCANCEQRRSVEGHDLCSICYREWARIHQRHSQQRLCSVCNATPPNVGYQWCQSCYEVHVQSLSMPQQSSDGEGDRSKLLALLPSRPFLGDGDALTKCEELGECTICQVEYEEGEDICVLPMCVHTFHSAVSLSTALHPTLCLAQYDPGTRLTPAHTSP